MGFAQAQPTRRKSIVRIQSPHLRVLVGRPGLHADPTAHQHLPLQLQRLVGLHPAAPDAKAKLYAIYITKLVVNPEKSRFLRKWDLITISALM